VFVATPNKDTKAFLRVREREWRQRAEKFRQQLCYAVAESSLRDLIQRIPQRDDLNTYRSSLELVRVTGLPPKVAMFSIYARTKAHKVRQVDAPRSVLYIHARRRLLPPAPEVVILERYSPWTVDTLPFVPKRGTAITISRKVSRNSVQKVAKRREDDRTKWTRELREAGVKVKRGKVMARQAALPDVTFDATRLEFGLDRQRPHPHWRPTIARWKRAGIQGILREQSDLISALVGVGFQGWKSWPPPLPEIGIRTAQGFESFQGKLGIR